MTAYLQPGDQIHLAFPISAGLFPSEANAEAQREHDQFAANYAKLGVTVVTSSANSALTAPVVVAVFRTPAANEVNRCPECKLLAAHLPLCSRPVKLPWEAS